MASARGASIYICSEYWMGKKVCNLDIKLNYNRKSIIDGLVKDANGQPISNAAVELREVDPLTDKSISLGYSYTNSNGEYVFVLRPKYQMYYEIYIYSQLMI